MPNNSSNDDSDALRSAVQEQHAAARPITICGGGSKSFLGVPCAHDDERYALSLLSHRGVINYEPTELVLTARSGTPLTDIVNTLSEAGQRLAFEPPQLSEATLGGTLACGLSGPARPYCGSARDHVLGTRIINGSGEDLSFGGEVMKNVAGYDVSRLQIGAFGTLGVLLDVSLKVLPEAESTLTLAFTQSPHDTSAMVQLARKYLPLTASALIADTRYVRLAGSDAAVRSAAKQLGGEQVQDAMAPWDSLRDWTHDFFSDARPTWRISVADYAPQLTLPADADGTQAAVLYDWGGAQRWVKTTAPAEQVYALAARAGGHATCFSQVQADETTHQPLDGVMAKLQQRLRNSFDPQCLFNRGRFHPELDTLATTSAAAAQGS